MFDEPENSMASGPAPAVVMGVGSSVWVASSPSALAPEEKGWGKFTGFQPFCCSESGPRCSSPVDRGHGDAQGGLNQGPERTLGPATPGAWNACVTRKAPLVASKSREDKLMAAVASEAVSVGPGQEAAPRRPCQSPDVGGSVVDRRGLQGVQGRALGPCGPQSGLSAPLAHLQTWPPLHLWK